jgi:16S rRNA (adenine1518-N6/adenine1519-N6)-dimethyltransferase
VTEPGAGSPSLPPLREIIRRHGLAARKSLGQNFLLDGNLCARIARAAGPFAGRIVYEIGPGPGGLTRALLESGAERLIAIEIDPRCIAALEEIAAAFAGRMTILHADALEADLPALGPPPRKIVANLPYNVATPLLLGWLAQPDAFESLTLMFQREVAERLVAAPGDDAYGRLAIAAQWRWQPKTLFDVNPRAFTPAPKVVSTVVQFVPRAAPLAEADPKTLERVTAAAFGQRRKMLRRSLRNLGHDPLPLLAECGIDPQARAEQLDIPAFCALARAVARLAEISRPAATKKRTRKARPAVRA